MLVPACAGDNQALLEVGFDFVIRGYVVKEC
jgi:hypothetical protein